MVERLVIMTPGDVIRPEDLPTVPLAGGRGRSDGSGLQSLREARDAFERAYILG